MSTEAQGNGNLREQPIGDLLKQLSQETTTLVRQELDLAKAEMAEKGKQAGKGVGMFGGAGLLGLGAFAASRFLKASSSSRYSERTSSSAGQLGSGASTGSTANGFSAGTVPPPQAETRVVATATDEGVEIR